MIGDLLGDHQVIQAQDPGEFHPDSGSIRAGELGRDTILLKASNLPDEVGSSGEITIVKIEFDALFGHQNILSRVMVTIAMMTKKTEVTMMLSNAFSILE